MIDDGEEQGNSAAWVRGENMAGIFFQTCDVAPLCVYSSGCLCMASVSFECKALGGKFRCHMTASERSLY